MDIFQDFLRHFLEVFIDDFAVFSAKQDHLKFLRKTFERCRETNLKLHPGKCFLGMESSLLLGHVVSKNRLKVDLDKVKAILALTAPTNVREIRGFLGCGVLLEVYKRLCPKSSSPNKITEEGRGVQLESRKAVSLRGAETYSFQSTHSVSTGLSKRVPCHPGCIRLVPWSLFVAA